MGTKSRQSPPTTQTTRPWEGQIPYLQEIFRNAQSAYQNLPGDRIAPFSPWQVLGQQQQANYATGALPALVGEAQQAATGALDPFKNPVLSAYQAALPGNVANLSTVAQGAVNPQTNIETPRIDAPWGVLNTMMSGQPDMTTWTPIMEQIREQAGRFYSESVAPEIRASAMQAGQFGGSRQGLASGLGAERVANRMLDSLERVGAQAASQALQQRTAGAGLASELAGRQAGLDLGAQQLGEAARGARVREGLGAMGQLAQGLQGAYSPALSYSAQALGMMPGIAQLGTMPGGILQGVGAQQQARQQARLDAMRSGPFSDLQQYLSLVGGNYGGTTQSRKPIYSNPLGTAIGLGMMLSGFGAPMGVGMAGAGLGGMFGGF